MRAAIASMEEKSQVMSFLLINQGSYHYSLAIIARGIEEEKFSLSKNFFFIHFDSKYTQDTESSYYSEYTTMSESLLTDFNTITTLSQSNTIPLCQQSTQVSDYCGLISVFAARMLQQLQDTEGLKVRQLKVEDFPTDYKPFSDEIGLHISDLTPLWDDTELVTELH